MLFAMRYSLKMFALVQNCLILHQNGLLVSYDEAEKHLGLADKAQRNKDMFSHHMHMADYHDSLSQWHDSKGRTSSAEKHANKAADHEEIAHAMKDKRTVKEDIYTADVKVKKVQVQDKDGNWVFKDRKSHPHRINFGASKMNGKPDLAKQAAAGEGVYHQQKESKLNFESWVLKQKTTSSLKKDKKETEKASKAASGVEFKNPVKEEKQPLKKKKKYKEINDKEVPYNNNTSAVYDPFTPTP